MRPWTILIGFAALSGVAAVPPEAQAETKQAPASFDGHYIGPGDVAPVSGDCAPVAAIELIIKENNATIRAARTYQNSVASYTTLGLSDSRAAMPIRVQPLLIWNFCYLRTEKQFSEPYNPM
jgi:hypothetical protein